MLLLSVLHLLVRLAGSGGERLARRAGQAAEYRADLAAARIAGRDAAAGLLTTLTLRDHAMFALRAAVNRRERDVWAAQRATLAAVPAREVRGVERCGRQRLQAVDDSHPPTHFRLDVLRPQPAAQASVPIPPDLLQAMDDEEFSAVSRVAR